MFLDSFDMFILKKVKKYYFDTFMNEKHSEK